jgi:hypothetical protein
MTIEKQPQSRRAFLSNSVAGIASIGLAGTKPGLAAAQSAQQPVSGPPIQRDSAHPGKDRRRTSGRECWRHEQ